LSGGSRPTLTVVTCNYNHGPYLAQSIEAVIGQSRPPDQYIIVDDGSTDNSVPIIESYARRHPVIQFVRHKTNQGLSAASARAWSLITSEYFLGAAADDYLKEGFLEDAMTLAARYPEAGLVFGRQVMVWADGAETPLDLMPNWDELTFAPPSKFLHEYLRRATPLASPTATFIFRRVCFEEVGRLRAELGYWGDAFAARAVALKYGACFVPRDCAAFRVNTSGYGGRQMLRIESALPPISNAISLMRIGFADRFPPAYVDEFERASREDVIEYHCWLKYFVPPEQALRRRRQRLSPLGRLGESLAQALTLPKVVIGWISRKLARKWLRKKASLGIGPFAPATG